MKPNIGLAIFLTDEKPTAEASEYYGIRTSLDVYSIIDTLPLSRKIEKELGLDISGPGTHVLDAVCRRFNVSTLHHHNALDDAEMCGNLLAIFLKKSSWCNSERKRYEEDSNTYNWT